MLTGEIKIGDNLIWEPKNPRAFERITVEEVKTNSDGELWILSRSERGSFWNEESRFREACELPPS